MWEVKNKFSCASNYGENVSKFFVDTFKKGPTDTITPLGEQIGNLGFLGNFQYELIDTIKKLTERIDRLIQLFEILVEKMDNFLSQEHENVIDLKEINFEEAKKQIKDYFERRDGEVIYPTEIERDLGIYIDTVLKAIKELEKENKIRPAGGKNG